MSDKQKTEEMRSVEAPQKSFKVAYFLLIFFGLFGLHRLYLRRWISGLVYLTLFMLAMIVFEELVVFALLLGLFVDLFLIPRMTRQCNERLATEFEQHPERFSNIEDEQIAPWARDKKPGLLHMLGTPVRIAQFILLPALFTLVMVLSADYEVVVFPVIILLTTGLMTSLGQLTTRYPSLLNLPGVEDALEVEEKLRRYYWNNEPRWAGSLLGMITRARTEYAPYWKIVGLTVFAVLIDGVFSFGDNYAPYLSFGDAFEIISFHVIFIALAVLFILSPMGALSYHYSLSGKRSRLRVLTVAALGMIGITFFLGTLSERDPGDVSLLSSFRLELRMQDEGFKKALNDNVSMFLMYYPPDVNDMACVDDKTRNTCQHTIDLRELLNGMAPNDENEAFQVFDLTVGAGEEDSTVWRGVRYLDSTVNQDMIIAATDGEVYCQPLIDAKLPIETKAVCDRVLPQLLTQVAVQPENSSQD